MLAEKTGPSNVEAQFSDSLNNTGSQSDIGTDPILSNKIDFYRSRMETVLDLLGLVSRAYTTHSGKNAMLQLVQDYIEQALEPENGDLDELPI